MSDLIERLLAAAECEEECDKVSPAAVASMREAAARIRALEAELDAWKHAALEALESGTPKAIHDWIAADEERRRRARMASLRT